MVVVVLVDVGTTVTPGATVEGPTDTSAPGAAVVDSTGAAVVDAVRSNKGNLQPVGSSPVHISVEMQVSLHLPSGLQGTSKPKPDGVQNCLGPSDDGTGSVPQLGHMSSRQSFPQCCAVSVEYLCIWYGSSAPLCDHQ